MLPSGIRKPRYWAAAVLLLSLAWGGWTIWSASSALREAGEQVASEGRIPFTLAPLEHAVSIAEPIGSPAVFRDLAAYQGRIYLCGPAGLFAYSAEGALENRYRVGIELPPAPLTKMAVGLASDSRQPELFIATSGEGVLAFDGSAFRQIRPEKAALRKLTALLPLPTGRLLLGTEKDGVLVYDGRTLAPFHSSLNGIPVTALAGADADIWIGTLDRGVLRWHAGQVDQFTEGQGLPDARVLSLAVHGASAYAGTAMGVAEFRDGRFHRLLGEGLFARALLARDNSLAVGTLEEGVVEIPLDAHRPRPGRRDAGAPASSVERVVEWNGRLYALLEDGLYDFEEHNGAWRRTLGAETGVLTDRNIAALAVEPSGRLWIGYFDRGLDLVEPGGARAVHVEDEHLFCVNRIATRPDGAVVATANGLVLLDSSGHQRRVLGRADGLIANHVTDVLLRPDGMTLATPAGITFLDAGGARSLYAFHGLVNNHVYALAAAGDRVLAGTLGGLSILESGLVRASFTTANSPLKHNWITAITGAGSDFFIGTYGAGVFQLDAGGGWRGFNQNFEVNPNAMLATDAAVYAGTLGRGLAIYNRGSARWTFRAAGLPSANVTALAAEGGRLYVGTDNGLVRIAEKDLTLQ